MRTTTLCVTATLLGLLAGCARHTTSTANYAAFGEPMKLSDSAAIPVSTVLAEPAKYDGKFVRLSGQVTDVCQEKGCWLKLAEPGSTDAVFVKFTCPTNGRLIPTAAAGKPAVVEGILTVKTIPESEARHLAEESGKPTGAIKGPQRQITLRGPSARVQLTPA